MNADLAETLAELGPEYRAVVSRMTEAFAEQPPAPPRLAWRRPALLAASLLVCLGGAWLLLREAAPAPALQAAQSAYVLAYSPNAETVRTIVRTQQADGSWANDFITRQNAAALRLATDEASRIAYRRAVRYLRAKGLTPLSDTELRARGDYAARQLAQG